MNFKNKIFILIFLVFLILPIYSKGVQEVQYFLEGTKSENVGMVMKSIHFLDKKVEQIDSEQDLIVEGKRREIETSYLSLFESLNELKPEIWETDQEFEIRKAQKVLHLLESRNTEIQVAESLALENRNSAKEIYVEWLSEAYSNLTTPRTIPVEELSLEPLEYQRNERRWPIRIDSTHPLISFDDLEVVVDFEKLLNPLSGTRNFRQEIIDFDIATRTGKLSCEVIWTTYKDKAKEHFIMGVSEVTITNELTAISYVFQYSDLLLMSAYTIVGSDLMTAQAERVSVITDIQPLFVPEIISEKPVIPTFQIEPENIFNKSLSFSVDKPELVEFNSEGELFVKAGYEGKMILSVTADGGLFHRNFPITIIKKQKQEIAQETVEEPQMQLVVNAMKAPPSNRIPITQIKHKGIGIGITAGYPAVPDNQARSLSDTKPLSATSSKTVQYAQHVVVDGEDLNTIAALYSLNAQTLISVNQIRNVQAVKAGISLEIPDRDGQLYTVKEGDMLSTIARKYSANLGWKTLQELNGLKSESLSVGQQLFIPDTSSQSLIQMADIAPIQFQKPALGSITALFGQPYKNPATGTIESLNGILIEGSPGSAVVASAAGNVVSAGNEVKSGGKFVELSHEGGYRTTYTHLENVEVKIGMTLSKGEVIGSIGTIGTTYDRPTLFFSIEQSGIALDPSQFF